MRQCGEGRQEREERTGEDTELQGFHGGSPEVDARAAGTGGAANAAGPGRGSHRLIYVDRPHIGPAGPMS
ncbi:hypothetical protein GCM10028772_37810 [Nocardioides ultimimeridianus]